MMYKEIGSDFWLNRYDELENKEISLDFLQLNISDVAFISTGRSAISFVLEHIKISEDKKVVLLPPFTCHTVIEPFINAGYKVFYYSIDRNLKCSRESFLEDIERYQPSVVLVHGYFGFDTLSSIKDVILDIRKAGIIVIEDITQTMYSEFVHTKSDYYVCSFRKWAALPDGGCAISTNKSFSYKPDKVDKNLQEAKMKAFHAKYLYMCKDIGNKDEFLKMFKDAEQILCNQQDIFAMSDVSKMIQGNLQIDFLRERRRENFQILCRGLTGINFIELIFNYLPKDVVPLYFPVYVKHNRKILQKYLAENNIYAPIVWPKPIQCECLVTRETNWIYDHILSIPCDQRYSSDDMKKIVEKIIDFDVNFIESTGE